ncbi:neurocan core protein-like isoform X2 [Ruditapes philippinarum]|uniref:neurocan core protein-like isoform X2 n=1 Tax=Ruditapes philippinarum TaxID=129788 RepID=UPI00295B2FD0|nr:neurocan core protein-like isoform X2 [Ruditapes philippinarum]
MEGVFQTMLMVILLKGLYFCSGDCETGWRGLNSSCYYLNKNKLSWTDSRKWCFERSSYLVEVESDLENNFLQKIASDAGYDCHNYHIGLYKHDADDTWKWNTSGNSVKYRSWYKDQPSGDGRCVQYAGNLYQWNDVPCRINHCFICERTQADSCSPNPCLNQGTCVQELLNYTCECPPGISGKNCEKVVLDCSLSPCRNGGTCIQALDSDVCVCKPGFTGANCEYGECTMDLCHNGGTCISTVDNYTCACANGYTGNTCEGIDHCLSDPCKNNGICLSGNSGFECACVTGYEGTLCTNSACIVCCFQRVLLALVIKTVLQNYI